MMSVEAIRPEANDATAVGAFRTFWGQFRKNRLGMLGAVLVVLIAAIAIFAPLIVTHDPIRIMVGPRLAAPSLDFLLGTDQLGRDTFSRTILGSRIPLFVAFASLGSSLAVGLVLGLIAGFGPRWLDNLLLLFFDTIRSFPSIIFALALIALLGPSLASVILVIAITSMPIYARVVRTQTEGLRNSEYIAAERSMGAGTTRILAVHILPNVLGPLVILVSMDVPAVIAVEAGLSFLGMGVRPPTPDWGAILNDGYSYIDQTPWLVFAGGVPIVLATLGFTFLGEALREIFDPKLRKDL
ncbi:MAG: ABC transporter permease subunit [Mesorhizobium sp.]|uniref:ABC transporter permease n=1 Tax=unclassified Mesorhizobium TaxID=325217 RepID=UPI000FCCD365|nr:MULTISPECIES: ABC transporter permease [unclassified Mesorhizobium]RUU67853.1 ABC transporter permease [Mesorhizobium sp. M7A.T.Ca.TU.009.01.1.1]RVD62093.1 ABC transporter permease [Mesorhizobium sp. M8A.F.Ca.ET.023.02.2.1]TGR36775.1 ABC transporter permease [bacterium M00.F.Ca.ET.199.01.1.1]TGU17393.1 ABC transporter permease [bacterium M00.F.Ca.ET.156.01.1.1]TGV81943.1 ABC transporter permease [Mesorhizobium sp. M00.F.Ca.ET.149.01.1.1]